MKSVTVTPAAYLSHQLGSDESWLTVNEEIWQVLESKPSLGLSDLTPSDKVLPVLALLTTAGFLKMEYIEGNRVVPLEEIGTLLKAWHRDETITDEEWRVRAEDIQVKWRKE
jgi:hypothetical protein